MEAADDATKAQGSLWGIRGKHGHGPHMIAQMYCMRRPLLAIQYEKYTAIDAMAQV